MSIHVNLLGLFFFANEINKLNAKIIMIISMWDVYITIRRCISVYLLSFNNIIIEEDGLHSQ